MLPARPNRIKDENWRLASTRREFSQRVSHETTVSKGRKSRLACTRRKFTISASLRPLQKESPKIKEIHSKVVVSLRRDANSWKSSKKKESEKTSKMSVSRRRNSTFVVFVVGHVNSASRPKWSFGVRETQDFENPTYFCKKWKMRSKMRNCHLA